MSNEHQHPTPKEAIRDFVKENPFGLLAILAGFTALAVSAWNG